MLLRFFAFLLIVRQGLHVGAGGHQAHLAVDLLAVLEEDDGGDGHDAVAHGQLGLIVHVHLADDGLVAVLLSQLLDHGTQHAAGTAPIGPEVHHHQLALVQALVKTLFVKMLQCHILFLLSVNLSLLYACFLKLSKKVSQHLAICPPLSFSGKIN